MTSPVLALRAAIRARSLADALLAALMGGTVRLFDEPPRGEPPVYALFGDASVRDWSDSGGRGHEQQVALVVWSRPGSTASALAAAARIGELLDDAGLTLDGHRLVSLSLQAVETGRDPDTQPRPGHAAAAGGERGHGMIPGDAAATSPPLPNGRGSG